MTTNKQDIYMANAVMQASKEELTLMLYNGAIKFCNKAIMAINEKDMNNAHHNILKVEMIISEFKISLNPQYEVTQSFAIMYEYLLRRLVEANIKKDSAILEEVNGLLRELRDTWKEAMQIAKGVTSSTQRLA